MATGNRIRYYREKRKWTLEDLEVKSGVPVGTISALENRDSSRSKFFTAIAGAFGMSVEQLEDENNDWLDQQHLTATTAEASATGTTSSIRFTASAPMSPALGVEAIAQALTQMTDAQREVMAGKLASLARAPDSPTLKKSISESLGSPPLPPPTT